jgi:flagellar hook-length control protein FliK
MTTSDTALLIQPVVTPTVATQSRPAEGFQQMLQEEAHKLRRPEPEPRAAAGSARPARQASPSAGNRIDEAKAQAEPASSDVHAAEASEGHAAEAPGKAAEKASPVRKGAARSAMRKPNEGVADGEAVLAQGQNLPSEVAEQVFPLSVPVPEQNVAKTDGEAAAPIPQTTSAVALLASLLVQTTGDLKGVVEVVVEAGPQTAEPVNAARPAALPPAVLTGAPPLGAEAGMGSADSILRESFAGAAFPEGSSVPVSAAPAVFQPSASPVLPDTWIPNELASPGKSATIGELMAGESALSERLSQVTAISTAGAQVEIVAIEEVETVQSEPVPQNVLSMTVAQDESIAVAAKPALAEIPQKLAKSRPEATETKALPEPEAGQTDLDSESVTQQSAQPAAGDAPQKNLSGSNQPESKLEVPETVHRLKPAGIRSNEAPSFQVVSRAEEQGVHGKTEDEVPKLASLPENQIAAAKPAGEMTFHAAAATVAASSGAGVPELVAPAGIVGEKGEVAGAFHANTHLSQVEKAQVVSQIVERAHLLGKNQSELMVVLKPEFLGRVNLHAAMVNNQLVATIVAESASVKQMLEGQLGSLQAALHEQGLPVAKVEVVQGSQLSFADLGSGHGSSQQHLESGKSRLPDPLSVYETSEETAEVVPQEARFYAPSTSRSLNLVA